MEAVTHTQLLDQVLEILRQCFPQVNIYGEKPEGGFTLPALYGMIQRGEQTKEGELRYRRRLTLEIQFHPLEDKNRSCYGVVETLYRKLEMIQIGEGRYRGIELNHEMKEGVLHFYITYPLTIYREREKVEFMKTLEQQGGIKA